MGDSMRSCKRTAETVEMEASSTSFALSKRRKAVGPRELQGLELTSPDIELENPRPRFLSSPQNQPIDFEASSLSCGVQAGDMCSGLFSGDSSASRCSSNESCDILKDSLRIVDLEPKSFETEISTCTNINKFSRETTPLSKPCGGDSYEMESPAKKPLPSSAKPPKMPSQAEIDEFFSVAEKYEQKRFAEKYNFDIVKDVPLHGRYQWLRLKP